MGSSPRGRGKQLRARIPVVRSRLIPARAGKTRSAWRGGRWRRTHPRAGGENAFAAYRLIKLHGSSPRGRGKQGEESADGLHEGLIPARAGKTCLYTSFKLVSEAHPRAGGENRSPLSCHVARSGSSPRGRGKHVLRSQRRRAPRLIPARAGKTVHPIRRCGRNRAHPRAGGENFASASTVLKKPGSSPRGRGKRRRLVVAGDHVGLIPARAGKTSSAPSWQASRPAHPRAGGENAARRVLRGTSRGSSPRGRGKRARQAVDPEYPGLIPARAGKTRSRSSPVLSSSAHPRAGGENTSPAGATGISQGSSPRGRGKRRADHGRRDGSRAHPRAGGENGPAGPRSPWAPGSSPRGRGKRAASRRSHHQYRLIPARAGKT